VQKQENNEVSEQLLEDLLISIRKTLKDNADQTIEKSTQRYFKENVKTYGIKSACVKKIAQDNYSMIKKADKKDVFYICEKLFQSGYLEESFIACNWSYRIRKQFKTMDFKIFESWINNHITNWASCDTFCNHTVGCFIETYPEFIENLQAWAKSKNRWMRRASVVSLIVPAKKGFFLQEILHLADILLLDKDDMVQKGYGWLLKVSSAKNEKTIFNFVMDHKKEMPRTSLRYAIEKMPVDLKKLAMEK
jgi:3-methyladenine DNA glycosylase AlkD